MSVYIDRRRPGNIWERHALIGMRRRLPILFCGVFRMKGHSHGVRFPSGKKAWIGIAAIVLAAAAVFLTVHLIESGPEREETRGDLDQFRQSSEVLVEWNGVTYRLRKDLKSILLVGVDNRSDAETTMRIGGQADFQRVIVIDPKYKKVYQIALDRDTMAEVTTVSILGNKTGTRTLQLSLAYSFGDGGAFSAKLQAEAVSRFLMDVKISDYAVLSMDGIAVLNDLVGGVTVTVDDEMTSIDPTMTVGARVTLTGEKALKFVRARMSVGEGTNVERMGRQESYLSELLKTAKTKMSENKSFIGQTYDAMLPHMVTNIPKGRLVNEAWASRGYEWTDAVTIAGTHQVGEDGFMEFHPDPDSVRQVVLDIFFEPVAR